MLAQPKNVPICGPRQRELGNIVFEQQVASNYENTIKSREDVRSGSRGKHETGEQTLGKTGYEKYEEELLRKFQQKGTDNFRHPHHMQKQLRGNKVGESRQIPENFETHDG